MIDRKADLTSSRQSPAMADKNGSGIVTRPAARPARAVQSVDRAIDILEVLSQAGREMQLREIAEAVGLNVSTCHHLINTFVARGFVGRNPYNRAYFLGHRILELSNARVQQFNLVERAMPELRRLNEASWETVHLAVMQGIELVTLTKIDSLHAVRVGTDNVGKASAMHATATGKAVLAWLPEHEMERVVATSGLTRFTPRTCTSFDDLKEELRHVRRRGFASDDEEFQPGVFCIGCAVRDGVGGVIASISCSMPKTRANKSQQIAIRRHVIECARNLSAILDGRPATDNSTIEQLTNTE